MAKPAMVAVRQGDEEAFEACSSFSAKAALREFMAVKGAVWGVGDGLEASAFMMVCRGISVDLMFFLCARYGSGRRRGLGRTGAIGGTLDVFGETGEVGGFLDCGKIGS